MLTDIEIAQAATPCPITEIAEKTGISEEYLECYGKKIGRASCRERV